MRVLWSCTLVASLSLALLPTPAEAARPCRLGARAGSRCGLDQPIPQYAPPRGLPALIVGISLFAFSVPPLFLGTKLAIDPDIGPREWPYAGYQMLMTGVAMAAIAIPLTAIGAVRFDRYLRWKRQWALAPAAGRTPGGGYVGVTFRF